MDYDFANYEVTLTLEQYYKYKDLQGAENRPTDSTDDSTANTLPLNIRQNGGNNGFNKDTSWMNKAECLGLGPDIFFTTRNTGIKLAQLICNECVVRYQCCQYAINTGEKYGIWGGKTPRQRHSLARKTPKSSQE